jgi:hypothetical protein
MTDEAALVRQRARNAAAFHVDTTGPPAPPVPKPSPQGTPAAPPSPSLRGMSRRRSAALRLAARRGLHAAPAGCRGALGAPPAPGGEGWPPAGGAGGRAPEGVFPRTPAHKRDPESVFRAPCRTLLSRLFRPPQPAARGGATPAPATLPRPSARSGTPGLYHLLAPDGRERQRITGVCGSMPTQSSLPRSPPQSWY